MRKIKGFAAALFGMAVVATGCIDDKYDLSDIDTNVRLDVNDLVVPVNIDEIRLSSIINVKEGERVQIIDGHYAVVDSGSFTSTGLTIDIVTLDHPEIKPSESVIYLNDTPGGIPLPGGDYNLGEYDIKSDKSDFEYNDAKLDKSIIDIESISAPITLTLNVTVDGISKIASKLDFYDVVIQLPAGFVMTDADGGEYNPDNGELKFAHRRIFGDTFSLTVSASSVNFHQMGGTIIEKNGERYANIKGNCFVKSGRVQLVADNPDGVVVPEELTMHTIFTLSDIRVDMFTGTVKYDIEGVDIEDITLSDLPKLISQEGTKIRLANPRIYFHVNNPVQEYGLSIKSGLTITSYPRQSGMAPLVNSLDNGTFTIGTGNPNGIYNYCVAPEPDNGISGYENCMPVKFTGLQNVLDTEGLPASLGVSLDDPAVPPTRVVNFRLGVPLGDVEGRYKFIAPFQLLEDSKIVYSDVFDGWGSEDLDDLTITKLDVDLDITSDLPLAADLTGYPIDAEGNRIDNVSIVGGVIDAYADHQHITISLTGAIKGLNGIEFEAILKAEGESKMLTPEMSIRITNLRPRVSGYYEKEL